MNRPRRILWKERRFWMMKGFQDPLDAFHSHKAGAKGRGVPFLFTFEQWWELWAPYYHMRGSKRGQLVMCRRNDEGAYEPGNVRIDTAEANAYERAEVRQRKNTDNGRRLPIAGKRVVANHAADADWMRGRHAVLYEYSESEDADAE